MCYQMYIAFVRKFYMRLLKYEREFHTITHFYDEKNHGFHNDTTPRFDKDAAKLAWRRTIKFLNKELG